MKHLISNLHKKRHFLYCLLLFVLFFGCSVDEQYKKPVTKSDNTIEYKGHVFETITYDGHDYIISTGGGYHAITMVHSASCKKCSGH
jgi:hypothetical protein